LETAMAPAANDALGYGPIGISAFFGAQSLLILFAILVTFDLSRRGFTDKTLLSIGLGFSISGYTLLYIMWENPTTPAIFFIPVVISCFAFPFSAGPTRSLFTNAVARKETLRDKQGSMQAALSMVASIAGFVAPGLISSFVLRSPEEVADSTDNRELNAWALYAPMISSITLLGHWYVTCVAKPPEDDDDDSELEDLPPLPSETTDLLGGGNNKTKADMKRLMHFNSRTESARLHAASVMGIPNFTFDDFEKHQSAGAPLRRMTTGGMDPSTNMAILGAAQSMHSSSEGGKPNYRASSYV